MKFTFPTATWKRIWWEDFALYWEASTCPSHHKGIGKTFVARKLQSHCLCECKPLRCTNIATVYIIVLIMYPSLFLFGDICWQNLSNLQMHLNALIDERTSGGRIQVHGDILAMHLLNETKNLERFTRLLTEQYDTHCAGYKCLNRFNGIIKVWS